MDYFYILISFVTGAVLMIAGVTVGAYFVFRTRYAVQDIPFLQKSVKKTEPASYVSDLFPDTETEDEMSEAAKAIREQKNDSADVMSMLRGKK